MQFCIRLVGDLEARSLSLERLFHFLKTLKPEGDFKTKDENLLQSLKKDGSIRFENVSVIF